MPQYHVKRCICKSNTQDTQTDMFTCLCNGVMVKKTNIKCLN